MGEVLRKDGRVPLRFTENLGFGTGSVAVSAVTPRESADGEAGECGPVGDLLGERVVYRWKRAGFEGERDSVLRSWRMESMVLWWWVGDSKCAALLGEW